MIRARDRLGPRGATPLVGACLTALSIAACGGASGEGGAGAATTTGGGGASATSTSTTGSTSTSTATGGGGAAQGPIAPGDFSRFADLGWIDMHVHLRSHHRIDDYVAAQDRFGMQRMVLQCMTRAESFLDGGRPTFTAEGLLAKAKHPSRFHVFAGLDLSALATGGEGALADDLEAQVNELADAGADGLKVYMKSTLVEPMKSQLGFDYLPDNPVFAKAFTAAGERGLPILIHLDEPYFPSGQKALKLYPKVTWIVTHLAWAQTDLARLETILAASPSIFVDFGHFVHLGELLPAGAAAASFLSQHRTRFFQSTDFASGCDLAGLEDDACPSDALAVDQAWKVRAMLETTQPVTFGRVYGDGELTVDGLGLPADVLAPIYHDNAASLLGAPRPLGCGAAIAHVDRLASHTTAAADQARLAEIRAGIVQACP